MAYRKLFVVVDPHQDDSPALMRASRLLARDGGLIHVYSAVYHSDLSDHESREEGRSTLRQQAQSKLHVLTKPLASDRIEIRNEVEWSSNPDEAAMRACSRIGADLLIKSAPGNTTHSQAHLLRHSPAPVLLVRHRGDQPYRTALAAIALEDNDLKHDTLNNHVVAQARKLCDSTGAELHTVSALEGAPNIGQILKILEDHDEEKLSGEEMIARSFGIDHEAVHIDYGPAKAVIAETAKSIDADVLVIGTVARSGLSGAIVGNTCEKVLAEVDLDVLTVS
jgi:universal stress protein E